MTTTDGPACTLPAPALADRLELMRREIAPHVTRVEPRPNGFVLELAGSPALHATLARVVELERECCASVGWELEGDPDAATLRLVVDGIDPRNLERLGLASEL